MTWKLVRKPAAGEAADLFLAPVGLAPVGLAPVGLAPVGHVSDVPAAAGHSAGTSETCPTSPIEEAHQ